MKEIKRVNPGKTKKIIIISSTCACVVFIVAMSAFLYLNSLLGKINYVPISAEPFSSDVTSASSGDTADQGVPLIFDKDVLNIASYRY